MKSFIGFCHRVAYAIVLGVTVGYIYLVPSPLGARGSAWVAGILNLPVSVFCQVTGAHAINTFASSSFAHLGTFEDALFQHLRVAVPVYVVLFYVPNIAKWLIRRMRRPMRADTNTL